MPASSRGLLGGHFLRVDSLGGQLRRCGGRAPDGFGPSLKEDLANRCAEVKLNRIAADFVEGEIVRMLD